MNIYQLIDYFNGKYSNDDLPQILKNPGPYISEADKVKLKLNTEHLVRLCDAFLAEVIKPKNLVFIAEEIVYTGLFDWNSDDRISEVVDCWATPEANYLINKETIKKFKYYLISGDKIFTEDDFYFDELGKPRVKGYFE